MRVINYKEKKRKEVRIDMEHPFVPVHILEELSKKEILGAGHHAIVYADSPEQVIKKYYSTSDKYKHEAKMQMKIQKLLQNFPIRIPDIYYVHPKKPIIYMERIHPPSNFAPHQIHLILGYDNIDELDCLWHITGIRLTRGFFAGPDTINSLAKTHLWSQIKISNIAYIMGSIIRHLLDNYIIPNGIKWSVDYTGRIWLFNFSECVEGRIDPVHYFYIGDFNSITVDYYIPKINQNGYLEYYNGYFGHNYAIDKNIDNTYFCIQSIINGEEVDNALKNSNEQSILEKLQYTFEHI